MTWLLIIAALAVVAVVVYKKRQAASTAGKTASGISTDKAATTGGAPSLKMVSTVAGPMLYHG